jgi:hypothetical protein
MPLRSSCSGRKADAFARRYMFLLDGAVTACCCLCLQINTVYTFTAMYSQADCSFHTSSCLYYSALYVLSIPCPPVTCSHKK